ncbi:A-kinase anchor protein 4-like [Liasis olivaceus]
MTTLQHKECPNSEYMVPVTMMTPDVDWLHCRASLCKVSLFNDKVRTDKERKLVCFVDVSSLNTRDQDQDFMSLSNEPNGIEAPDGFDLEEREIVVIKDENKNSFHTEGAVCFFRQSSCEKGNVGSWLSSDLQKYAIGFQHALSPSNGPSKTVPFEAAAERSSQNGPAAFSCSGA